jgi:hypothetical protein
MFVDGIAVLVGLASPRVLTMATLSSFDTNRGPRLATVVKTALDDFIATLAPCKFKTRLIMPEGEGAVGKLKTALILALSSLVDTGRRTNNRATGPSVAVLKLYPIRPI